MTIDVLLNKDDFIRFTMFDVLRRRKMWRSPVLFALILSVSACICFWMHRVDGAVLLGTVLLIVGLGMPCVYFLTFYRSLKKQLITNDLLRPRKVYTLCLTEKSDGIAVANDHEHVDYRWADVYHVYWDTSAAYLYITPERAFILPYHCIEDSSSRLWALISVKVPKERMTDLRK